MPSAIERTAMAGCEFAPRCPLADDLCVSAKPAPHTIAPGHWSACHRPERTETITAPPPRADQDGVVPGNQLVLKARALGKAYRQHDWLGRVRQVEALRGLDFEVREREFVGIVGESGSGKSTLTKLVQRLYVPERGRVLVDGTDLALADPAWLRRQLGVVLQENFLFNRSVRENIALIDPGMPLERVIRAAELAGAHEFIVELPQGYDTVVGEHGASLSGGQRQRIAIARALVADPRILIFDEATSALDYESERAVMANMRSICQGRTVLIIAHRLSTVRHANRIVVVDKGRIVETGTPDELLKRPDGHFTHLSRLQQG